MQKKTNKKKERKNTEPINKYIYWIPRISSILLTLFLMLFSLDVFGEGYGFWGTILAFLIHNIPAFMLAIIVIISWKKEWVGAAGFAFGGILYIIFSAKAAMNGLPWYIALAWSAQLAIPALLIAGLWYLNWHKKRIAA